MESSSLKNMVVLKNLPSNIIDEAIVILKNGNKIKDFEKANKEEKENINKTSYNENFIIDEAEMIINNYASKVEKSSKMEKNKELRIKYNKLKKYASVLTVVCFIQFLILLII